MSRGWSPVLPNGCPCSLFHAYRKALNGLNHFRNNGICSPSPWVYQAQGAVGKCPRQQGRLSEASCSNVNVGYPRQFWYKVWGLEKRERDGEVWRPGKAGVECCSELSTGALETTAEGCYAESFQAERPFRQPSAIWTLLTRMALGEPPLPQKAFCSALSRACLHCWGNGGGLPSWFHPCSQSGPLCWVPHCYLFKL